MATIFPMIDRIITILYLRYLDTIKINILTCYFNGNLHRKMKRKTIFLQQINYFKIFDSANYDFKIQTIVSLLLLFLFIFLSFLMSNCIISLLFMYEIVYHQNCYREPKFKRKIIYVLKYIKIICISVEIVSLLLV